MDVVSLPKLFPPLIGPKLPLALTDTLSFTRTEDEMTKGTKKKSCFFNLAYTGEMSIVCHLYIFQCTALLWCAL